MAYPFSAMVPNVLTQAINFKALKLYRLTGFPFYTDGENVLLLVGGAGKARMGVYRT